jgi:hypothetical protein
VSDDTEMAATLPVDDPGLEATGDRDRVGAAVRPQIRIDLCAAFSTGTLKWSNVRERERCWAYLCAM